ncbi:MAG: hypothetical protein II707_04130 [Spirochaetales bacterium]|nr:hypothetical protein [Spirochaetales bacterium]
MNAALTIENDTMTDTTFAKSDSLNESRQQLYSAILAGLEDVKAGRTHDAFESLNRIRNRIKS